MAKAWSFLLIAGVQYIVSLPFAFIWLVYAAIALLCANGSPVRQRFWNVRRVVLREFSAILQGELPFQAGEFILQIRLDDGLSRLARRYNAVRR